MYGKTKGGAPPPTAFPGVTDKEKPTTPPPSTPPAKILKKAYLDWFIQEHIDRYKQEFDRVWGGVPPPKVLDSWDQLSELEQAKEWIDSLFKLGRFQEERLDRALELLTVCSNFLGTMDYGISKKDLPIAAQTIRDQIAEFKKNVICKSERKLQRALALLKELNPWEFNLVVYEEHGWEDYNCQFCGNNEKEDHAADCKLASLLEEEE